MSKTLLKILLFKKLLSINLFFNFSLKVFQQSKLILLLNLLYTQKILN